MVPARPAAFTFWRSFLVSDNSSSSSSGCCCCCCNSLSDLFDARRSDGKLEVERVAATVVAVRGKGTSRVVATGR